MIQIYVDQISPRIKYTFEFIFGSRGLTYTLTEDQTQKVDLVYSSTRTDSDPTIPCASFMSSDKMDELKVEISETEGIECFSFSQAVDPIASIFYVLSRYEEYGHTRVDEYGRFPLSVSNMPKSWLQKAMCDRWVENVLSIAGVDYSPNKNQVKIVPSFDIDNSYAYKLKAGKRKTLSVLKDILRLDFKRINERRAVLSGKLKDPYDTFDKIQSIYERFPATKVFWLIGKWGKKDRNISIENKDHQELIKSISAEGIELGLHPSFGSFQNKETIVKEKKKLELVCSKDISASRQHFLRFQIPSTFSDLNEIGFSDEYSMGFAEHVGFRSGTARKHQWFDLSKNEVTNLNIHPFVYMDGTLREYMKLSIEESKRVIQDLYDEVKHYGGDFIFIWHNETIGDYGNWKGWSEVLDFTLSLEHESD